MNYFNKMSFLSHSSSYSATIDFSYHLVFNHKNSFFYEKEKRVLALILYLRSDFLRTKDTLENINVKEGLKNQINKKLDILNNIDINTNDINESIVRKLDDVIYEQQLMLSFYIYMICNSSE